VLVGTKDGDVYLLDAENRESTLTINVAAPLTTVSLSADGEFWLLGTRDGRIHSTSSTSAAARFRAAQTAQRNLLSGIPLTILAGLGLFTLWIQRTAAGAHFWNITSLPVRRTLVQMW